MNNLTNSEENSTCKYTTFSSTTEQIGYLYIIPAICCLGICFNTLVLLVFHRSSFRKQMTPSLVIYLTGLTIADLFNALVASATFGLGVLFAVLMLLHLKFSCYPWVLFAVLMLLHLKFSMFLTSMKDTYGLSWET